MVNSMLVDVSFVSCNFIAQFMLVAYLATLSSINKYLVIL